MNNRQYSQSGHDCPGSVAKLIYRFPFLCQISGLVYITGQFQYNKVSSLFDAHDTGVLCSFEGRTQAFSNIIATYVKFVQQSKQFRFLIRIKLNLFIVLQYYSLTRTATAAQTAVAVNCFMNTRPFGSAGFCNIAEG